MSLPSIAIFYDENNVSVGSCFVNCGWFLTTTSLVRALDECTKTDGYKNRETVSVKLYGYVIPKKLMEDCSGHTFKDVESLIDSYIRQHCQK
jgi:hypothetical protein